MSGVGDNAVRSDIRARSRPRPFSEPAHDLHFIADMPVQMVNIMARPIDDLNQVGLAEISPAQNSADVICCRYAAYS